MNKIILKGMIRNIEHSHNVKEIEYQKAELIVPRTDGEDDVLDLKFKRYANQYTEGQIVWLQGNVRSYSQKLDTGKNKVELYVFTYFDIPDVGKDDQELINQFQLDGKVCKVDKLRKNKEPLLHCAVFLELKADSMQKLRELQSEIQMEKKK